MKPLNKTELNKAIKCSCVAPRLHSQLTDEPHVRLPNMVMAAWGYRRELWRNGTIIKVKFLGGSAKQQSLLWERFKKIDGWCGLSFQLVKSGQSQCRAEFNLDGGHWSYVGKDNLSIPQSRQTMNIALRPSDPDHEWDRVGIHEIFHLCGLNHEHQHPRAHIPWNKEAVYQLYGQTQGWTRQEIDFQVLNPSSPVDFVGTVEPDKDSIMMYPIEASLVTDPSYAVGWNTEPSATDLVILRRFYPLTTSKDA